MRKMKLAITRRDDDKGAPFTARGYNIFIDDLEISDNVDTITITMGRDLVNRAVITLVVPSLEIPEMTVSGGEQ